MHHRKYEDCIAACNACAVACNYCAASCLRETDVAMMAGCIALDMDCAQVCDLAVGAMARESAHVKAICDLCAKVSQACADECGKHTMDHCKACAKACIECAQACQKMALAA